MPISAAVLVVSPLRSSCKKKIAAEPPENEEEKQHTGNENVLQAENDRKPGEEKPACSCSLHET